MGALPVKKTFFKPCIFFGVLSGFLMALHAETADITKEAFQDSYVAAYDPDGNFDAVSSGMEIRGGSGQNPRYIFVRWDLNQQSLGSGDVITAAQIRFVKAANQGGGGTGTLGLREVTGDAWDETVITWNNQPAAGADVLATVDFSSTDPDDTTIYTFSGTNIVNLVNAWIQSPDSNKGIRLESAITWGLIRLYDSESATAAYRPTLEYTVESNARLSLIVITSQ